MKLLKVIASRSATHLPVHLDDKGIQSRLESLAPDLGTGFLNFHWLALAVELMISCHSEVEQRLFAAARGILKEEQPWISAFLHDNAKFLELCNEVKMGMDRSRRSAMRVKYVLHILDGGPCGEEERILKVKKSLKECLSAEEDEGRLCGQQQQKNSSVQQVNQVNCCTIKQQQHARRRSFVKLKRLNSGKQQHLKLINKQQQEQEEAEEWFLEESLFHLDSKGVLRKTDIPSKVYEANLVTAFVLSALLTALPCKGTGALGSFLSSSSTDNNSPPWVSTLSRLKQALDEESKEWSSHGGLLGGVYGCLKQIEELLLAPSGDESKMKQLVQQASKKLEYFDSGMEVLEEQINRFFRKLVSCRSKLLAEL